MHEQRWDPQAIKFDHLERLELHVHRTNDFANFYVLEQFLQSTQNIANLVISARQQLEEDFRLESPENSINRAWAIVFEQQFPRLKTLSLRVIVCTEEDLASFLINHRATLLSLSIRDLVLRNWRHQLPQIDYDNSVVRLLWLSKHMLTLNSLKLRYFIANDWTEIWMADASKQDGHFLDKIVASVCGEAAFPFTDYVPYVLPTAWLRLAEEGLAAHGRKVDDYQNTTNLVKTPHLCSDALASLVKTDLHDFAQGNLSALPESIPTSEGGFELMLDVLKNCSDESWTYDIPE